MFFSIFGVCSHAHKKLFISNDVLKNILVSYSLTLNIILVLGLNIYASSIIYLIRVSNVSSMTLCIKRICYHFEEKKINLVLLSIKKSIAKRMKFYLLICHSLKKYSLKFTPTRINGIFQLLRFLFVRFFNRSSNNFTQ